MKIHSKERQINKISALNFLNMRHPEFCNKIKSHNSEGIKYE